MQEKFNNIFSHLLSEPGTLVTDDHLRSLMFGDYLSEGENKVYDEVADLDSLQQVGSNILLPLDDRKQLIFWSLSFNIG